MFEQSLVDARVMAQRPWTLAVSLAGQTAMVGMAIAFPLMFPEAMQIAARMWIPIDPPRAYHPPQTQAVRNVARTVSRSLAPRPYIEPARVPSRVAMIRDDFEDAPMVAASTSGPGVPGGIDLPGIGSAAIARLVESTPKPPPAPQAVHPKEPPRSAAPQIKQGGEVQAALLIFGPKPEYPPLARQARISGVVVLDAVIATDGTVLHLQARSGHPLLLRSAVDAVRRWRYQPTRLNGEPVEVATEISVHFMLQ